MKGMKYGPPELMHTLEQHANLINLLRIRVYKNLAFSNMQLNISPPSVPGHGSFNKFISNYIVVKISF